MMTCRHTRFVTSIENNITSISGLSDSGKNAFSRFVTNPVTSVDAGGKAQGADNSQRDLRIPYIAFYFVLRIKLV
jgi:hypothetical protein